MIITKKHFLEKEDFYFEEIKKGKIFIYPTDTIYGIGCDATNAGAIQKIRRIKQRDEKPFSIIVPGKEWILKNCVVKREFEDYLKKLPGKFTLILELNGNAKIAKKELVGEFETIGIRIPDSWFAEFLSKKNLTFVTTSVNISGEKPISKVAELKKEISDKVDYVIDDGVLEGNPSTLINLSKEKVEIVER
jgi:L-threonylcarbamoyladenylate synthase